MAEAGDTAFVFGTCEGLLTTFRSSLSCGPPKALSPLRSASAVQDVPRESGERDKFQQHLRQPLGGEATFLLQAQKRGDFAG
jgi:hypothetical protein